ncbi:dihydrodipicolinate synthase family protein (plasmid) [Aliirhizobium terrae]|uniref:dihydrodipicolinate synthase family protein n=1 Tax=Terrirhizobium terrae TaxID=2926709 RepID=UPI0025772CBE|nr:dihydrodipicolinate synthase family protein [Rhizobium sp. CC-CFT758]WJH38031.1 dihydrodipicolinate synthase family protein [Rhizobium sp. CC-CFT758]
MTPFHRAARQTFTPLLTPFGEKGVDLKAFNAAIDRQIIAGTDGIVVGDAIGEGPVLTAEEHDALLRAAVGHAKPHLSIIAATGTNCTRTTIERSRRAEALGADALLVTVPYYSKPTLAGVVDHFRQVAAAVGLPILIDDDPGRTAKDFGQALLESLADCHAIAGVCHGADRLAHFAGLPSKLETRFLHLTRDDAHLPQFLALGGNGAISPIANIIPSPIQTMVGLRGSVDTCSSFGMAVSGAIAALGQDDIAALKEAASFIHQYPADMRLPLVPAEPETVIRIRHAFAPFARCETGRPMAA